MTDHDTTPHVHGPSCDHDHPHVKQEPIRKIAAPGRNEPCWCDSGRKYKLCHWKADRASS